LKAPIGVVILAVWCFLGAAIGLHYGTALAWEVWQEGYVPYGAEPLWERILTHPAFIILPMLLLAIFYSRLGWGLWKLENAARLGFIVVTVPTLVGSIVAEVVFYRPRPLLEWISDIGAPYTLFFFLLVYLFLPSTRRAFKGQNEPSPSSPSIR